MIDDPGSVVAGLTAHIEAQKGADAVTGFLDALRAEDGSLPKGLKVGRSLTLALAPVVAPAAGTTTLHSH